MSATGSVGKIAREVARRLRANDNRGNEAQLRENGAQCIENLVLLLEQTRAVLDKYVAHVRKSAYVRKP